MNISGAIIKRVPHGVGTWKTLDRSSSKYADEKFSFYYGEWYDGFKHGRGIEVDDSGIYSGLFVYGFRNGQGRMDYCNGSAVIAEFSVLQQHKDRQTGPFRNPYMENHRVTQIFCSLTEQHFKESWKMVVRTDRVNTKALLVKR